MAKKESPKGGKKPEKVDPAVQDVLRRKQLEATLSVRTMQDEAFRKKFLADPKAAIKEYVNVDLGKVQIVVHEETANTIHVSVPPLKKGGDELSDSDLEAVAGGRGARSCRNEYNDAFNRGQIEGIVIGGAVGYSWIW